MRSPLKGFLLDQTKEAARQEMEQVVKEAREAAGIQSNWDFLWLFGGWLMTVVNEEPP